MNDMVTKEDLRQFGLELLGNIGTLMTQTREVQNEIVEQDWIKSKQVRLLMNMSPGSIQNLRVTQKVRYKKILGSYYYNKVDLLKLFTDERCK
ncbi:DNA-binding protein [Flavobacterium muglaense]|uniref:DNA-binding protein n=1 Tax=Flavobacterium muglaense TaxID=2764716 RepID=A0A923N0U2_9FLAO|nr:DNA-binding protein [Flavobacterium muglaense]MBC5838146.1 DNA-binding protein [Flavobacterium muglaense]MBC5844680.1 DNA-binding protein [Flavobacterium muglaense]